MSLSGVVAVISRYFAEFVYDVVVKQLLGLVRFQNLLLIVCDHTNTICAIIHRKQALITCFDGCRCIDLIRCID